MLSFTFQHRKLLKRVRKIGFGLLAGFFSWCVVLGLIIWRHGAYDHATKSDCIIVLGAAVRGATASPVFEERILHGVELYNAGYANKLIFTGGFSDDQLRSESSVGQSLAIQRGIPMTNILLEENSHTTQQNLCEAQKVMQQNGLVSTMIVSDPQHMKRAMLMASDLGITAVSSPTSTSRYRSVRTKLGFLIRELYFIHHYFITGN